MINRKVIASLDLNNLLVQGKYIVESATNSPITTDALVDVEYSNNKGGQVIQTVYTDGSALYKRKVYLTKNTMFPDSSYSSNTDWYKVSFENVAKTNSITFAKGNAYDFATAQNPARNIYTQNAVTVVSDRNSKNSIQAIDDKLLNAWSEVEQKQYKLNGDDKWSFGYIAQDVVDAFTRHGLDYKQYNIVHEENGKFMLKYDMCAVLDSALTRKRMK